MAQKDYASQVKQKLNDVNFPVSKQELIQKKGNEQVEISEGRRVSIRDALQPVRTDRFNSQDELINEINQAHNLNWQRM